MSNYKPTVAVTGPNNGGFMAWLFTAMQVRLAGGKAVRIKPEAHKRNYCAITDFDALIIGGGTDVHPINHNSKVNSSKYKKSVWSLLKEAVLYPYEAISKIFKKEEYDLERDEMERAYYLHAKKFSKPVLGICRGHQLIHLIEGAAFISDTDSVYKEKPRIKSLFPRKQILIDERSKLLKQIFQTNRLNVNAIHTQALAGCGREFICVAKEKNSIIQAAELPDKSIITVQWHPEYLIYIDKQRRLFQWLVNEATEAIQKEVHEEAEQKYYI